MQAIRLVSIAVSTKTVRSSLDGNTATPGTFDLMNKGITILARSVKMIDKDKRNRTPDGPRSKNSVGSWFQEWFNVAASGAKSST